MTEEKQALVLIGHGPADGPGNPYLTLREEFRASYPETWLILLRGEPSAGSVLPELQSRGIHKALLFPLLLSSAVHFSRDLSREGSPLRRAFADAGIETEIISGGLLDVPEIRAAVRTACMGLLPHDGRKQSESV